MTVNLYMTWETPYLPAVAGLTVEAWPASNFTHSPVGHPSAYPPAPSPTATTTTDSSGDCELTGLTAGVDYYISIIDANNQPWFQFCPQGYLGNSSGTRRRWSIHQGPVAVVAPVIFQKGTLVFEATMPHGSSGVQVWAASPGAIALSAVLYDPYSASDGTGFAVPAGLVGQLFRVECDVEYGGATASVVITATLGIVYAYSGGPPGGLAIQEIPVTLPAGNVAGWDQAAKLEAATAAFVTGASMGETIRLVQNAITLGSGSSMAWGGVYTGTGLYTVMRVFTC